MKNEIPCPIDGTLLTYSSARGPPTGDKQDECFCKTCGFFYDNTKVGRLNMEEEAAKYLQGLRGELRRLPDNATIRRRAQSSIRVLIARTKSRRVYLQEILEAHHAYKTRTKQDKEQRTLGEGI